MTLLSSLHPQFTYFTYYGHGRSRTCKEVVWLDLMISSSFHPPMPACPRAHGWLFKFDEALSRANDAPTRRFPTLVY